MKRFCVVLAIALACTACSGKLDQPAGETEPASSTAACIPSGGGYLRAQLRGAVIADVDWTNSDMQCDGGPRPDGQRLRVTFAGRLPGTSHQLRLIFGIDERDVADGAALAMPTNLTIVMEGEQQLYATRGSEHCAVEALDRTALEGSSGSMSRVHARGYCVGPATNAAGDARVLVPTFEFTGIAAAEPEP